MPAFKYIAYWCDIALLTCRQRLVEGLQKMSHGPLGRSVPSRPPDQQLELNRLRGAFRQVVAKSTSADDLAKKIEKLHERIQSFTDPVKGRKSATAKLLNYYGEGTLLKPAELIKWWEDRKGSKGFPDERDTYARMVYLLGYPTTELDLEKSAVGALIKDLSFVGSDQRSAAEEKEDEAAGPSAAEARAEEAAVREAEAKAAQAAQDEAFIAMQHEGVGVSPDGHRPQSHPFARMRKKISAEGVRTSEAAQAQAKYQEALEQKQQNDYSSQLATIAVRPRKRASAAHIAQLEFELATGVPLPPSGAISATTWLQNQVRNLALNRADYKYLGAGTDWRAALKSPTPINALDELARIHDLQYWDASKYADEDTRGQIMESSDDAFIDALKGFAKSDNPDEGAKADARLVLRVMQAKHLTSGMVPVSRYIPYIEPLTQDQLEARRDELAQIAADKLPPKRRPPAAEGKDAQDEAPVIPQAPRLVPDVAGGADMGAVHSLEAIRYTDKVVTGVRSMRGDLVIPAGNAVKLTQDERARNIAFYSSLNFVKPGAGNGNQEIIPGSYQGWGANNKLLDAQNGATMRRFSGALNTSNMYVAPVKRPGPVALNRFGVVMTPSCVHHQAFQPVNSSFDSDYARREKLGLNVGKPIRMATETVRDANVPSMLTNRYSVQTRLFNPNIVNHGVRV